MKRRSVALFMAMVAAATGHAQTVIVNETFDSYADEAALHAVWGGLQGATGYPVFDPPSTPARVEERFELVTASAINADFNGNTKVDAADYALWRKNNGLMTGASQAQGDANGDGKVDNADYVAWSATFGTTPTGGGGSGKYVRHLPAAPLTADRLPDGNIVYQPPLDPNYLPDFSIFPSDGLEPIVLRGDMYVGSPNLQRNSIALRSFFDGASANLIEMGVYNDPGPSTPIPGSAQVPTAPDCAATASQHCAGFAVRVQLFNALPSNPNWQFFAFDPLWDADANGLVSQAEVLTAIGPGWHRYEVTVTANPDTDGHDLHFTIDLLRDGMNNAQGTPGVDAELVMNNYVGVTLAGFNSLRLGGVSGLPSTGEAWFDNIYLSGPQVTPGAGGSSPVPEPSAVCLAFLAVASIVGVERRRSA